MDNTLHYFALIITKIYIIDFDYFVLTGIRLFRDKEKWNSRAVFERRFGVFFGVLLRCLRCLS